MFSELHQSIQWANRNLGKKFKHIYNIKNNNESKFVAHVLNNDHIGKLINL
jgi:hypothetical protein